MNKNILIVDDDVSMLQEIGEALQAKGYSVTLCSDSSQAQKLLIGKKWSVVVIDVMLKGASGLDLMHMVRSVSNDTSIIIMTGFSKIDFAIESLRQGVYDFIQKPFDIQDFLFVVGRAANHNSELREQSKILHKAKRKLSAFDHLKTEHLKLEEVLKVDQQISAIHNLNTLIDFVIEMIVKILKVEKCSVMFIDHQKNELCIKGAVGLPKDVVINARVPVGRKIAGIVAEKGVPLLVKDIEKDKRGFGGNKPGYKGKSFICSPIKYRDKILGVVNVSDKIVNGSSAFSEMDLKLVQSIIYQSAVSLENIRCSRRMEYQTTVDPLTKIYNYRFFVKSLDQEINRMKRYHRPLSIMMIDVDYFKPYNDTYGHMEGDKLLRKVGKILKDNVRAVDVVCRYAGDEFVIILPETSSTDAEKVAQKILRAIEYVRFKDKVSVSIGIASGNKSTGRYDIILKADQALYRSKRAGKSCTTVG